MVQTEVCTAIMNYQVALLTQSHYVIQSQYIFLHDAILEGVTTGWTDIPVDQLAERMGELDEVDFERESGYQTEFNVSVYYH